MDVGKQTAMVTLESGGSLTREAVSDAFSKTRYKVTSFKIN